MRIVAAPRGLSIAEAGEGGSNRRPLPLHPIPGLLNLHKENQPKLPTFTTAISGSPRTGIEL